MNTKVIGAIAIVAVGAAFVYFEVFSHEQSIDTKNFGDGSDQGEIDVISGVFDSIEGNLEVSFDHVAPGEYSEVYALVDAPAGAEVAARLHGVWVVADEKQIVVADENGQARFTWQISEYGEYDVEVLYGSYVDGRIKTIEVN